MQVTEVANDGLKRAYTVLVPAGDIAADRDKRLAKLGKELRLPGFRPGKVPPKLVASRYGQAVMGEVLEEQVNEATRQVVADRGLRPALEPKVEVVNFADGTDLEFKVELEILPDVPMPDLSGLSLERLKAVPGETEIAKALEGIAARNRTLEDIAEARGAAVGEVAVCDFVGRLVGEDGTEGEPFPGGSANDVPIEIGGEGFIAGFAEQLEGIAAGETRTISVTFPADYASAEVAGKPARFAVTAKALRRPIAPAVDDELAKAVGVESLEQLRGLIRDRIQSDYDQLSRLQVKRKLLDALAERADFAVPEGMVTAEFAPIWERVQADLQAGKLDPDDAGKDAAALEAEYRGIAERRIRLGLLLSEIGRTNSITVTSEEMTRALRQEVARYPGQEQQVMEFFRKTPQAAERLRAPIFEEKVVDFLLELAKVAERQVSPEELSGAPIGGASDTAPVAPD